MRCSTKSRAVVVACTLLATCIAGWDRPARSALVLDIERDIRIAAILGIPATPTQPKPFTLPAQPIVAASSDGYLPSSWAVTPKGEFTFTLPLAIPPGDYGFEVSWTDDTGEHDATWHIELRPGPN